MYFFLLIGAFIEDSLSSFDDGLKMITMSLLFESCRKNIIFSYILILLEFALVSILVTTFYTTSIKITTVRDMVGIFCFCSFTYLGMSVIIFCFFDKEDFLNRIRINMIERLENVLGSEESENSQQISVSTNYITSD